jgi:phage host-nuclease inhibitor protein Gam
MELQTSIYNSNKRYSVKDKENIKREIGKLEHYELLEVLKILKEGTDKISENKNGTFINLKNLDDSILEKIEIFIEFCKTNRERLEKDNPFKNIKRQYSPSRPLPSYINEPTIKIKETNLNYKEFIIDLKENNEQVLKLKERIKNHNGKYLKVDNSMDKMKYPNLKQNKLYLTGVKARLFKKCREINRETYRSNETTEKEPEYKPTDYNINDNDDEDDGNEDLEELEMDEEPNIED